MPIVNRGHYIYLDAQDKAGILQIRSNSAIWDLRDWSDADYYYCEIKLADFIKEIPISKIIDQKNLQNLRNNDKFFLVLSNAHESFHSIVEPLYRYFVIDGGISARKIILMSESPDLKNEVIRIADNYGKDRMNVEWMLMFEKNIKCFRNIFPLDYKKQVSYNKKFLNLNRRWRLHRVAFVALLIVNNLIDRGNVSLGFSDDGRRWNTMVPWLESYFKNDKDIYDQIVENRDRLISMRDLYLDTENLVENKVGIDRGMDEFYEETFFSVVSETNFNTSNVNEQGRFLSEKIFKPISYFHPFILLSVPNSLDTLKDLGYRTFHPWINESYDKELDDIKRLKMIVEEVKRLCSLTNEQILELIKNTKSIVIHNFENLMSREIYCYKKL